MTEAGVKTALGALRRAKRFLAPIANGEIAGSSARENAYTVVININDAMDAMESLTAGFSDVEQTLNAAISSSPEPLKDLGKRLAALLDADQFNNIEPLLLAVATQAQALSSSVQPDGLRVALEELVRCAGDVSHYKASNYKTADGSEIGIEDDNGEKAWIVPDDVIFNISEAVKEAKAALSKPQAVPEGYVSVPKSALDWLFGEGPDANGNHFGDGLEDHDPGKGRYWWRSHFRKLIGEPSYTYDKDRRTLSSSPASGWRDIESDPPPKDGTFVLVTDGVTRAIESFENGRWGLRHNFAALGIEEREYTHWQPLPSPPSQGRQP